MIFYWNPAQRFSLLFGLSTIFEWAIDLQHCFSCFALRGCITFSSYLLTECWERADTELLGKHLTISENARGFLLFLYSSRCYLLTLRLWKEESILLLCILHCLWSHDVQGFKDYSDYSDYSDHSMKICRDLWDIPLHYVTISHDGFRISEN